MAIDPWGAIVKRTSPPMPAPSPKPAYSSACNNRVGSTKKRAVAVGGPATSSQSPVKPVGGPEANSASHTASSRGCKLSGLIRPEKLGVDPTLNAIALYLNPIPVTLRNFEARTLEGSPKDAASCRGCSPDVYAGTLHKGDTAVLGHGDGLARSEISGRRGRADLGRSLESAGRRRIRPGECR